MLKPTIELIPIRNAVRTDAETKLHVLLRITPAVDTRTDHRTERLPINLGLVLDRSGSMDEDEKMAFAKEAAIYAVQKLLPTDRVSVTIFDDVVETIVPNSLVENRDYIKNAIEAVYPRSMTALYDGWEEGANQVFAHLFPNGINRVFLLSDGIANVGLTNTDEITANVNQKATTGVSTTTIGMGLNYNEELMEAMAMNGDGRYYYVKSSDELSDIFQQELRMLSDVVGDNVSLHIEPCGGTTVSMLNNLSLLPTGSFKLPNLVSGLPLFIVVKLKVPPAIGENDICSFRLTWNAIEDAESQEMLATLRLPSVTKAEWKSQDKNQLVVERKELLRIASCKKQMQLSLKDHDRDGAALALDKARKILASAPQTTEMEIEERSIDELERQFNDFEEEAMIKQSSYGCYSRSSGCA